ncbi:P-loop NTPase [Vibrio sp. S4M6]|uniref:AAA family ATPase n=1 Tax=Vibrio sinus TaxID=2946865 RepID=UPI00202A85B0|nr:P-loop NTPase [Vibrio sinus]MCL9780813.1 P-loop NTPase [Vibrio sinus]
MFDLVDVIKNHADKSESENQHGMVLFHQSEDCKSFIEEACRFEGLALPKALANVDKNIQQYARENKSSTLIIELSSSDNVTAEMERISHLLPNNASVIVVGTEGTINTIRSLKSMGFHYLFWPACQEEFVELFKSVNTNTVNNTTLSPSRKAKKVAILGAKGGVGASFFTTQLARSLSEKHNSSCVIADYNFTGGNLDILLGIDNFAKRAVNSTEITATLDDTYAMSMTHNVNQLLSLLSIESEVLTDAETKDILRIVIDALSSQYNFVLEDYSNTATSREQLEYIANNADIILLVMDKSISSLREAKRIVDALQHHNSTARRVTILNSTRPEKAATVSEQEIKSFLDETPDIMCAYEASLSHAILKDKALHDQKLMINTTLDKLTSLVLGKPFKQPTSAKLKQWLRKVS